MSKSHQVYAVGNAIVDYVFKLTNENDWPKDIEKGTTLLIDENILLAKLVDTRPIKLCGGTGANTLSVIKQMGGNVFLSCSVADDADGALYHQNLVVAGITTNLDSHAKKTATTTGKCIILVAADADRSLCTNVGASGLLAETDLDEAVMAKSEYVFVELFLATSPQAKATAITAIKMAKKLGCKVALTLSTCKIPGFDKNHLSDMLGDGVDLLFCNELEAKFFCNTDDMSVVKEQLKKCAKQFVITRSGRSTIIYNGNEFSEVATYFVKPIDTTGAGDVFAGAFLYALTSGASFKTAADIANFAAAKVVVKYGARLDHEDINDISEHLFQSNTTI